ncbi:hypothetical protein M758_3G060800 [Ceratodon purpureus]|uniref:Uncharacterized protein n=1 Tax=Ceratodon purpureus TaxID=3225 RepID=A0A8T0IHU6_CERPU|nr:hypothetical protein KC19_3G061200 [Ceratodon purpureus]KAG0621950.1 hypothetical protein M758_3G060800 [Ceratodon purpureus]
MQSWRSNLPLLTWSSVSVALVLEANDSAERLQKVAAKLMDPEHLPSIEMFCHFS